MTSSPLTCAGFAGVVGSGWIAGTPNIRVPKVRPRYGFAFRVSSDAINGAIRRLRLRADTSHRQHRGTHEAAAHANEFHPPWLPSRERRDGGRRRRRRHSHAARPCRRVRVQIRQRKRGRTPDERAAARGGRSDQARIRRTRGRSDIPQQPARRRHRHAVAAAHRRDRDVQHVAA